MSVGDVASFAGLVATIAFGIWAVRRKNQRPSRTVVPCFVLMFLFFAQFLSASLLKEPLLPQGSFIMLVTALVIGIYWLARDEER